MTPEPSGFASVVEALHALEENVIANQAAWECKARLNQALNAIDEALRQSEAEKQRALAAILLFAEIPGCLTGGPVPGCDTPSSAAAMSSACSELEAEAMAIVERMGGLP